MNHDSSPYRTRSLQDEDAASGTSAVSDAAGAPEPPLPPPGSTPPPYGTYAPPSHGARGAYGTQGPYSTGSFPSGPPPAWHQSAPYGSPGYNPHSSGYNPHSPGYQPRPLNQHEERNWGMIAHLSSLSGYIGVPFGHILGPLVVLLTRGKESQWVAQQARRALNFNLTMLLASVACIPLIFFFIGIFLLPAILLLQLICTVIGAVATSNGQDYRYPLSIEFVK